MEMWGTELMKEPGSCSVPFSTSELQSWRVTWNCSLMFSALSALTVPSAACGA